MQPLNDDRARWLESLRAREMYSERSWWTTFLLSTTLGFLGADRFYLGSAGLGLAKFFTFGGFFIWWLADLLLLVLEQVRDAEGRLVKRT